MWYLPFRQSGGSLPLLKLPSNGVGVNVQGISANAIEKQMRNNECPIIGRIEEDLFVMDLRTTLDDELYLIENAFKTMLTKAGS